MPRPRVHPNARRRVAQACRQCKSSKRKCDASLPCGHCVKRGIGDACDIVHQSDGRRLSTSVSKQADKPSEASAPSDRGSPSHHQHPNAGIAEGLRRTEPTSVARGDQGSIDPSSPDTTRACMLSNNEGQQVFVGRSASLSFLQLVREVVARCIGPSEFSEYAGRDHMLEVDLDHDVDAGGDIRLDSARRERCIEQYFQATNGILDVITTSEAARLLQVNRVEGNSNLAAVRLLIIAIGAQTGPSTIDNGTRLGIRAFAQARNLMFSGMLENPSVDMIRAFLLLSFYMLGACRRNAAFMYLGIAARAAHALGLHTAESYAVLDEDKRYAQLKCWKSLISLDVIVSSILGRTTAALAQRGKDDVPTRIMNTIEDGASAELEASYRLALLVESVSTKFNGPDPITVQIAQSHLRSLHEWSANLPARLRPSLASESFAALSGRSLLGCMHISCFYYFAVMLVTRPFMIMSITQQLAKGTQFPEYQGLSNDDDAGQLASACVDAAIYLAQTCSDLLELDLLVENMCLLKAWVFAAGVVLGFQAFAASSHGQDTEQAFLSCSRVLERFATRSPLAAQYHDILNLLSSAVARHKQIRRSRMQRTTKPLVTRIMEPRNPEFSCLQPTSSTSNGIQLPLFGVDILPDSSYNGGFNDVSQGFPIETGVFGDGLNGYSIPSADSFMFDLQSFGMMPWGSS